VNFLRKSIELKEKDVTKPNMEEDELKHAKKYVGNYVLKTMNFGQKKEAQFKAVKLDANNPEITEIDTWSFRFHSLLNSIESAPRFKRKPHETWDGRLRKSLEHFIYAAPDIVGERLMDVSDEVNGFNEEEDVRKNSKGKHVEPSTRKSPKQLDI